MQEIHYRKKDAYGGVLSKVATVPSFQRVSNHPDGNAFKVGRSGRIASGVKPLGSLLQEKRPAQR
jgi:hypothetical protein